MNENCKRVRKKVDFFWETFFCCLEIYCWQEIVFIFCISFFWEIVNPLVQYVRFYFYFFLFLQPLVYHTQPNSNIREYTEVVECIFVCKFVFFSELNFSSLKWKMECLWIIFFLRIFRDKLFVNVKVLTHVYNLCALKILLKIKNIEKPWVSSS